MRPESLFSCRKDAGFGWFGNPDTPPIPNRRIFLLLDAGLPGRSRQPCDRIGCDIADGQFCLQSRKHPHRRD